MNERMTSQEKILATIRESFEQDRQRVNLNVRAPLEELAQRTAEAAAERAAALVVQKASASRADVVQLAAQQYLDSGDHHVPCASPL